MVRDVSRTVVHAAIANYSLLALVGKKLLASFQFDGSTFAATVTAFSSPVTASKNQAGYLALSKNSATSKIRFSFMNSTAFLRSRPRSGFVSPSNGSFLRWPLR